MTDTLLKQLRKAAPGLVPPGATSDADLDDLLTQEELTRMQHEVEMPGRPGVNRYQNDPEWREFVDQCWRDSFPGTGVKVTGDPKHPPPKPEHFKHLYRPGDEGAPPRPDGMRPAGGKSGEPSAEAKAHLDKIVADPRYRSDAAYRQEAMREHAERYGPDAGQGGDSGGSRSFVDAVTGGGEGAA